MPEEKIAPETPSFPATDLRTGTEVDPAVVIHHAAFLQGASYNDPYPAPPAEPKGAPAK